MMEDYKPVVLLFALLSFLCCLTPPMSHGLQLLPIVEEDAARLQTYIVYVERPKGSEFLSSEGLESWHKSFLPNATLDSGKPRLVYSYRDVMSGFAARLTPQEVKAMESKEGFIYARPDEVHHLQTTYTPEFLGLSNWTSSIWSNTFYGEGIVIGVLDTGILPTHPSFDDTGMPPKPVTWNGTCSPLSGVTCNNKIIGAVAFNSGPADSVIDTNGHGTHVASTAAGNFAKDASVLGLANGTAAGMAPRAHLAIYKVCFPGCADSDVLKAIEQAIKDGVDVLSMSLGKKRASKFYNDGVVHGSLSALSYGISTVSASGNSGPTESTLSKDAPWVLTIGASSTDRRIKATVKLGDGTELDGESAYQPLSFNASGPWPIVFPGEHGDYKKLLCLKNSLDNIDVRGKIVLCWEGEISGIDKGYVVYAAGGAAMVLGNLPEQGYTTSTEAHVLPVSHLSFRDATAFRDYYYSGSTSNFTPNATIIFKGTVFGHRPAPGVAAFSSRGPPEMNGGILKPDVLAPGVNILAAWPYDVGPNPSGLATKTFNFESGTSMATPHMSGIVALMKNKHRNWPPAYIQSAIITSALDLDLDGNLIVDENSNKTADVFATGAGQVNPAVALDPGLVYNIDPNDYVGYVCGLGYWDFEVSILFNRLIRCSTVSTIDASSLNYPSIMVSLPRRSRQAVTVERTVTNVGDANSEYRARITQPAGVRVDLSAYQLRFTRQYQERSFQVTLSITGSGPGKNSTARGKVEWVSNSHIVKSPIAIKFT